MLARRSLIRLIGWWALATVVVKPYVIPAVAHAEGQRCLGVVCFDEQLVVAGQSLPLRGVSLFEYWSFDVYTGAFYAVSADAAVAPVAKKLVLHYHRGIEKEDFIKSTRSMMKKNPAVALDQIAAECEQLFTLFKSVKEGDRYSIEYNPEKGTTLSLNDKALGTIAGEKFQAAMFGIWLSNHSVDSKFTDALVGDGKR